MHFSAIVRWYVLVIPPSEMFAVFSLENAVTNSPDYIKMSTEDMMQTLFMSATEEREIKTVETVGKQKAGGGGLPS